MSGRARPQVSPPGPGTAVIVQPPQPSQQLRATAQCGTRPTAAQHPTHRRAENDGADVRGRRRHAGVVLDRVLELHDLLCRVDDAGADGGVEAHVGAAERTGASRRGLRDDDRSLVDGGARGGNVVGDDIDRLRLARLEGDGVWDAGGWQGDCVVW